MDRKHIGNRTSVLVTAVSLESAFLPIGHISPAGLSLSPAYESKPADCEVLRVPLWRLCENHDQFHLLTIASVHLGRVLRL